jgi:hypothetical protein
VTVKVIAFRQRVVTVLSIETVGDADSQCLAASLPRQTRSASKSMKRADIASDRWPISAGDIDVESDGPKRRSLWQ